MKKISLLISGLVLCFSLAGCSDNQHSFISDEQKLSEQIENQGTDVSTSISEKEEGGAVSGELIKETEDLSQKQESKAEFSVSMTEVTEVVCPTKVSLKQQGVKSGKVSHFTYSSTTTNCDRGANILLPADYDSEKQYPVLYFLHGIFGNEYSMVNDGNNKLDVIAGNLKNLGYIEDIIIVFPNMFASSDPKLQPGFTVEQTEPYDNFINDLVNDLIPYVEANYSVKPGKENRALIGFSMGGRESIFIGVTRPDLFSCIGAISPAPGVTPGEDSFMKHPGQMEESDLYIKDTENIPKLFMICCGTRDSVVGKFPLSYHNIMENNNMEHLWYEIPNADHDNNAIKSGFYNFLIRWFYQE